MQELRLDAEELSGYQDCHGSGLHSDAVYAEALRIFFIERCEMIDYFVKVLDDQPDYVIENLLYGSDELVLKTIKMLRENFNDEMERLEALNHG